MELLLDPPFWAWLCLGGFLLLLEVLTGTFTLLWPAAAAVLVAFVSRSPILEGRFREWILFATLSVVLAYAARALGVKRDGGEEGEDQRSFNSADSRIGQTGRALTAFEDGTGRIRLGDTDWSARTPSDQKVVFGQSVRVTGSEGTTLLVEAAGAPPTPSTDTA
jgi:membrane protein implicated in regulation of membrane protease activity